MSETKDRVIPEARIRVLQATFRIDRLVWELDRSVRLEAHATNQLAQGLGQELAKHGIITRQETDECVEFQAFIEVILPQGTIK